MLTDSGAQAQGFECPDREIAKSKEYKARPSPSACYFLKVKKGSESGKSLKQRVETLHSAECKGLKTSSDCLEKIMNSIFPKTAGETVAVMTVGIQAAFADREKKRGQPLQLVLKLISNTLRPFENGRFASPLHLRKKRKLPL